MKINPSLNDSEYQKIANFVHQKTGIYLLDGKKALIQARLSKRIKELNHKSFANYFKYAINDKSGMEVTFLLDALSTNLTSFFREPRHFVFLSEVLLPKLEAKRKAENSRKLRIWSTACSSGEEPYTIAMVIVDSSPYFEQGADCKILATDLSTKVLKMAKRGIYREDTVKNMSPLTLRKHFQKGQGKWAGWYKIKDNLKDLTTFKYFNLMALFPFRHTFDVIFCRNVMIYFDKTTMENLVTKFYNLLDYGGYLFIGHSETLSGLDHDFQYMEPCIYKKV